MEILSVPQQFSLLQIWQSLLSIPFSSTLCKLNRRVNEVNAAAHSSRFMGEEKQTLSPSLFLRFVIRVVVWIHATCTRIYVFIYIDTSIKWCAHSNTHSNTYAHRQHKEGKKEIKKINQTKANKIHSTFKTQKEIHNLWWCELKCSITKESDTLVVKREKKIHIWFFQTDFRSEKKRKKSPARRK